MGNRGEGSDRRLPHRFEDEPGLDVLDLGSDREIVEDEDPQVLGVGDGDVHEVVVGARDVEHSERLGQREQVAVEVVDQMARVHSKADRDQRLRRAAEERGVDIRVEPADDAPVAESAET